MVPANMEEKGVPAKNCTPLSVDISCKVKIVHPGLTVPFTIVLCQRKPRKNQKKRGNQIGARRKLIKKKVSQEIPKTQSSEHDTQDYSSPNIDNFLSKLSTTNDKMFHLEEKMTQKMSVVEKMEKTLCQKMSIMEEMIKRVSINQTPQYPQYVTPWTVQVPHNSQALPVQA